MKRILILSAVLVIVAGLLMCCENMEDIIEKSIDSNDTVVNNSEDIGYTVELKKSEYSADDTEIKVVFIGKEPGRSIVRSNGVCISLTETKRSLSAELKSGLKYPRRARKNV